MNTVHPGQRIVAAVLLAWCSWSYAQEQTAKPNEASLVGSWLVTVEGEAATRTLVIADVAPTESGSLLSAKYGMSTGKQSPIEAKLTRSGGARQLNLITQSATIVIASEQPDGSFVGTFALKSGAVKTVTVTRIGEKALQSTSQPEDLAVFIPPNPDIPPACAELHGTWSGTWAEGGFGEQFLRVAEVSAKDGKCSLRLSYSGSKIPVPARETVEAKAGTVSFICNRSTGGTCNFKLSGKELWANYSNPAGGTNAAVFRKVTVQSSTALAQQEISLKSNESTDLNPVYWVSNCESRLKSFVSVDVLEGPPGVTLAIREQEVLPRKQNCPNKVPGGVVVASVKEIQTRVSGPLKYRVRYSTSDGIQQSSHTVQLSLYP